MAGIDDIDLKLSERVTKVETQITGLKELIGEKFININSKIDEALKLQKNHLQHHETLENRMSDRKFKIASIVFQCILAALLGYLAYNK